MKNLIKKFTFLVKSNSKSLKRKKLTEKEDWEFEWQSSRWNYLFSRPETKEKVLEYWIKYRYLREIKSIIAVNENSHILDVGCGISTVLHYLPGHRYGIDPLADRYKTIYRYPKDIHIQSAYGEHIPFEENYFDVVFSSNAIDHTDNPVKVISEIRRVLKPDGYFILTCEVFNSKISGERNSGHPHSLHLDELLKLIENFSVIAQWDSPWYSLRGYVLEKPVTSQREFIFLLKKS